MDIILVPGLWLDGSSWESVVPTLEQAGHRAHPLTLPGLKSMDDDRSAITLRDHVAAVVAAIDSGGSRVLLVGHSAGAGIAHAAVDARPDRVARAVYVGGFPTGAGHPGRVILRLDAQRAVVGDGHGRSPTAKAGPPGSSPAGPCGRKPSDSTARNGPVS
jgi:pimeloyl-ACP methyl ester carboxylesterase